MSEGAGPPTPGTPADPPAALPDDPAILRQMVRELLGLVSRLVGQQRAASRLA